MQNLICQPGADNFSPLRVIDPRTKIMAVVTLSILIFQAGPGEIILLSLFLAILIRLSGAGLRDVARMLKPIAFFAGFLFLLHLFFTPGREIFPAAGLPARITYEGLAKGGEVVWQFTALVTAGALLTLTTPPSELVAALERLLHPLQILRVPTQDLAIMVAMALRFAPTFLEEYQRMKTARIARGGGLPGERLSRRIKSSWQITASLLLSACRRAEDLAAAMEARGYARGPRTTARELRLHRGDYAAATIMISLTGLAVAIKLLL